MAKQTRVLWEYDKHTGAKHAILRAYLDRWLPIMATHNRKLVLIDGFAGPGEYLGGEDGSPVVMLNAFLQHSDRERIGQRELVYVFVERHQGRFAHLRGVLDRLQLPPTISAVPVQGDFAHVMTTGLLDNLAGVPMFAFLDPFGFKANRLTLTTRILGFPHCEALIYFPTRYLARFVGHPDTTDAFDLLYGGREWQECTELDGAERRTCLEGTFAGALGRSADYVRRFEILTASGGGYLLFFATNHELGLKKWKEAMWRVDPVHGRAFRYEKPSPQTTLFGKEPDLVPLRHQLRSRFGGRPFTVAQAVRFVVFETDYLESHLRTRTLAVMEREGRVLVERPTGARRNSWPDGTVLRFAE